jgi:hypothetical protein
MPWTTSFPIQAVGRGWRHPGIAAAPLGIVLSPTAPKKVGHCYLRHISLDVAMLVCYTVAGWWGGRPRVCLHWALRCSSG